MKWYCPKCGLILKEDIKIYNEGLKKHNINVLPILPTCRICKSKILFNKTERSSYPHKIIALTGTCASGKTSIADLLSTEYKFYGIDGDSVINVVKHKWGISNVAFNGNEMLDEIVNQIDILLLFDRDIVLSHVIMPYDIPKYREIFQLRNLVYKFVLLQPDYSTALDRSKSRTCFKGITPEIWVRYFYDELSKLNDEKNSDVFIFDNSKLSIKQSAETILSLF